MRSRYLFCLAPIHSKNMRLLVSLAEDFANVGFVAIEQHVKANRKVPANHLALAELEKDYQLFDVYIWLGRRLGERGFPDVERATEERDVVLIIHRRGKMTLKELVTEFKAYVSQSKDHKKEFMGLIKAIAYMTEVDGIKYATLNEATLVKYDLEQQ